MAVPVAILAGQVRGDLFAAVSLGRIVLGAGGKVLTPVAAETMIGDALGDSTLTLGLWAPERNGYVDTAGAPLELPRDSRARGVTEITRDDRPAAVLIHDPTLDTDSGVVEGLAAISLMLLENTRLVEELRTSRSRMVQTADRERRRLERDLHDGAQQRLMAVQIKLRLAQERIEDDRCCRGAGGDRGGGGGGGRGAENAGARHLPAGAAKRRSREGCSLTCDAGPDRDFGDR